MQQADHGIVHFAHHQAIVQFFRAAAVQKFLLQVRRRKRFRRGKEQIAHRRLGVIQERGAAVSIGLIEIRPGSAGHQLVLQVAAIHQRDFLGADAFVVHGIAANQRHAMEIFCARIIHKGNASRQNSRAEPTHPIALAAQVAKHLLHHRTEGNRRTCTVHRRSKHLRQQRRRGARLEKDRAGIVLRSRRGSQRHELGAGNI